jgi:DNA-directed RNA polymerase subunit beta'
MPRGNWALDVSVENSVYARSLAAEAVNDAGGHRPGRCRRRNVLLDTLLAAGVHNIKVRSSAHLRSPLSGVCATCHGRSLATGKLVDIGGRRHHRGPVDR